MARYNRQVTLAQEVYRRNLQMALELFEAGEAILRQNLRRENPGASEDEIEVMVTAWMIDRPSMADVPGFRRRGLPE
jgi:hypothetical protein